MDRRFTLPKRVTSRTWGPPPPWPGPWISKTTTLHVHHAFLYISLSSLHDYNAKVPNSTIFRAQEHKTTTFFFFSWTLIQGGASGQEGLLLSQNFSALQVDASASQIKVQIKLTYQYKVSRHSWAVHQDRRHFFHHKTSLRYKLSCQQCDNSGPWWWYKYSFYSTANRSHHWRKKHAVRRL